jgi:hypothetical protein
MVPKYRFRGCFSVLLLGGVLLSRGVGCDEVVRVPRGVFRSDEVFGPSRRSGSVFHSAVCNGQAGCFLAAGCANRHCELPIWGVLPFRYERASAVKHCLGGFRIDAFTV